MAPATCSATGSTTCCHTGRVFSTHSARLQAAEVADASGSVVAGSSQCSASRTASATRSVSVGVIDRSGAVSEEVAIALADGARERLRASVGVGVTGVAGPQPQDGKAVGTVFLGVVGPDDGIESVSELNLSGDRNTIRVQTVEQAVALLAGAVEDLAGSP